MKRADREEWRKREIGEREKRKEEKKIVGRRIRRNDGKPG